MAHLRMMAAAQPLPGGAFQDGQHAETASVEIMNTTSRAGELGLKAIAIYHGSSKQSRAERAQRPGHGRLGDDVSLDSAVAPQVYEANPSKSSRRDHDVAGRMNQPVRHRMQDTGCR